MINKEDKPQPLKDNPIVKKWVGYDILEKDEKDYTNFKLAYQYDMMAAYLLSLPQDDEDLEILSTCMFPIVRRVTMANKTIDTEKLYERALSKYKKNKESYMVEMTVSYNSIDAEAELIHKIAEEIIAETK